MSQSKDGAPPPSMNENFINLLMKNIPPFTLSFVASIFAVVVGFKVLGIDLGGPIQKVTDAYAEQIAAQAEGQKAFNETVADFEILVKDQKATARVAEEKILMAISDQSKIVMDIQYALDLLKTNLAKLEQRTSDLEAKAHDPVHKP